ncbi:hypothetical protein, conserved [Angomonas deanei]|uniref:Uncharacterized protein n=1 Tax=Angomonas deanei TaxID=59799 RepID=A0A7G2C155_9TRYP|nr:hypothetical protein, conserved [Angomonas deanei]
MFFRATRKDGNRLRSSSAGVARSGAAVTPPSNITVASDGQIAFTPTPPRIGRPASAPDISKEELEHVEQRLKIIKRSRASRKQNFAEAPNTTGADLPPAVTPPCLFYPVFNSNALPKHGQHVLEDMVGECLDVILFPGSA